MNASMPKAAELTARQAWFVQEYLVDERGAQAVIRAWYAVAGARVVAHSP
jgi:phage terminase small subunit